MKLKLKRAECGKVSTLGQLFVDDDFECFIIEDTDRQLETNPGDKVYGQTCIPRGTYVVKVTPSARFKRDLPLLVGVPGFEGIRIHPGNTAADTEGCLLPCTSYARGKDGEAIGVNSRVAFDRLFSKIKAADSVTIEIV